MQKIASNVPQFGDFEQCSSGSRILRSQFFPGLSSLNLKEYYFECAILLMNVMLRGSILYGSDMYYDLKESELRQLERIEEGYLRKILKTSRGCPITQLYLSVGQYPARFEVQKMRLLYLKYILEQDEESKLKKFFNLQLEKPNRGDWASTCFSDLKDLNITLSLDEIKLMSKNRYSTLLKSNIQENALKYLNAKQGIKGHKIKYSCLEMEQYLQPVNNKLTIEQKCDLFTLKNRMVYIPYNLSERDKQTMCICGQNEEDMQHIYNCEILNKEKQERIPYDKICNGNLNQQIEIFKIFKQNLEHRNIIISKINVPCDPAGSANFSLMD
jgi:hypothetical protein